MTHPTYDVTPQAPFDLDELERERPPASGVIVEQDRDALPFALVHGESLVATAAWAAGEAGIELIDASLGWDVVAERDEPLVLHDPLCPMTPPDFLARCVREALAEGAVIVGVRPVTDTIKQIVDGRIGATVDRDALLAVCSPIVLPPAVLVDVIDASAQMERWRGSDFVDIVSWLRSRGHRVEMVEAPPEARRVSSPADLEVLEAQTRPVR